MKKSSTLFSLTVIILSFSATAFATDNLAATTHKDNYPAYPRMIFRTGPKAESMQRGEYLVKLGDCIGCHTTHSGGKPFAGGLPIKTPFGIIYSPNITPDKKTGIGGWTTAQFIKAMRKGISPKGKYYFPAFPYPYHNKQHYKDFFITNFLSGCIIHILSLMNFQLMRLWRCSPRVIGRW